MGFSISINDVKTYVNDNAFHPIHGVAIGYLGSYALSFFKLISLNHLAMSTSLATGVTVNKLAGDLFARLPKKAVPFQKDLATIASGTIALLAAVKVYFLTAVLSNNELYKINGLIIAVALAAKYILPKAIDKAHKLWTGTV